MSMEMKLTFEGDLPQARTVNEMVDSGALHKRDSEKSNSLDDAGEKIGGARKDLWSLRGLSTQDLDSMSQEEQFANTTKSNVWNPDWNALITGGGMPVEVAAFLKLIYDRIAAKPNGGSEERRLYIRMLTLFKEHALKCRSKADVKAISQSIRNAIGFDACRYQYNSEP